jgi:hypothetical protein
MATEFSGRRSKSLALLWAYSRAEIPGVTDQKRLISSRNNIGLYHALSPAFNICGWVSCTGWPNWRSAAETSVLVCMVEGVNLRDHGLRETDRLNERAVRRPKTIEFVFSLNAYEIKDVERLERRATVRDAMTRMRAERKSLEMTSTSKRLDLSPLQSWDKPSTQRQTPYHNRQQKPVNTQQTHRSTESVSAASRSAREFSTSEIKAWSLLSSTELRPLSGVLYLTSPHPTSPSHPFHTKLAHRVLHTASQDGFFGINPQLDCQILAYFSFRCRVLSNPSAGIHAGSGVDRGGAVSFIRPPHISRRRRTLEDS